LGHVLGNSPTNKCIHIIPSSMHHTAYNVPAQGNSKVKKVAD